MMIIIKEGHDINKKYERTMNEFNKANSFWNAEISTKEIHESINSLAPLLLNNSHKLLDDLKKRIFADYIVTAKFTRHIHGGDIVVSSRSICSRPNKYKPIVLGHGVTLVEGTDLGRGGSSQYPEPSFAEGYCILKWTNNGLPIVDMKSWKCEIVDLKIADGYVVEDRNGPDEIPDAEFD